MLGQETGAGDAGEAPTRAIGMAFLPRKIHGGGAEIPTRAKAVTRGINDRCRKLRPHAELLVDGFCIPEQLRYAEMLHPEHIPDADEHEEQNATSAGTIEPK